LTGERTPDAILRRAARLGTAPWPIAETALAVAALDRPAVPLGRYLQELDDMSDRVARCVEQAPEPVSCLARVIGAELGYEGDSVNYDDLQNANLMRVMDRRKGLPVALGILYIHTARAQGWDAEGLAFPGHFLVRITTGPLRSILDPFAGGRDCSAADLRGLLGRTQREAVRLSPEMTAGVCDRDVVLRLLNNIAMRLEATDSTERAGAILERMMVLAPDDERIWARSAVCNAQLGRYQAAIDLITRCLEQGSLSGSARYQLARLREGCRIRLN